VLVANTKGLDALDVDCNTFTFVAFVAVVAVVALPDNAPTNVVAVNALVDALYEKFTLSINGC